MTYRLIAICRRIAWPALKQLLTGKEQGIRGVAAVEFAIVAPLLTLAMICTVDLGMGVYRSMQVQKAAQAGAEYAVAHGFNATAITGAITGATSLANVSATPAPLQFCGCAASTGVAGAACDANCSGGVAVGTYVTASAQTVYQTILPYPLLPDTFTFVAQSTVRLQ